MSSSEPIRILHVVQRMEAAGVQSFLMNIYRNIDREKYQFDFLTHYSEKQFYDDEILKLGGKIYRLTVREDHNLLKYMKDLNRFFNEHMEYQIVHGHMDSLGVFYLEAAKLHKVPCRIAHAHTVIIGGDYKKRLRNLFNRAFKLNATLLLACSPEAGEYMFRKSKFNVMKNPIDIKRFSYNESVRKQVREELQITDQIVIGHVGRFAKAKNHEFLLNVFQNILLMEPNAVLLLVGQGEMEANIHEKASDLGIEQNIIYLGVRQDVWRIYQAMDAFVFPSIFEGLGIVAIEAQSAGLPTLCSDRIPALARATDLFNSLSLEESAAAWAEAVLAVIKDTVRTDQTEALTTAGYDVKSVAQELVDMYTNKR